MKKTLKQADIVQVLLPSFKKTLEKYYKGKIVVIGNPIEPNKIKAIKKDIIIYPARIECNKQHHLLIEAFSKIAPEHPAWQVHCWGEISQPDYYKKCLNLIKKYHLEKQFFFKGITTKMPEKLAEAKICAFPSRFEGFSLGLTEALATGLPCIGFKNASGVNELIENNRNGFLCDNMADFKNKLSLLITSNKMLSDQSLLHKYAPIACLRLWREILHT